MQQPPYNPPGGPEGPYPNSPRNNQPYANQPYAAPPPARRGPNYLVFCLGCFGLAAIVVIGLFLYGASQFKKMTAPVTSATVSTLLPPGVPVYPRFTLNEKGSRNVSLPTPGGAGNKPHMAFLLFQSPDAISMVGPWYQKALAAQGWIGGPSPTDPNKYEFKKGNDQITLAQQPSRGASGFMIIMTVVQGMPAGATP